MFVVVKPFKIVSRKFAVNAVVTADDFNDGGPLTLQDWIRQGFVKAAPQSPATPPSSPSA